MTIPGLALFYGGLVRSKNMLSVLMQVFMIFSLIIVLWCRLRLFARVHRAATPSSAASTALFLNGIFDRPTGAFARPRPSARASMIPEFIFVAFQATFAAITCGLIVGAFAERAKFSAVLLFVVLWFTFAYLPIAHMVWFWAGPDAYHGCRDAGSRTAEGRLAVAEGRARLRGRHRGAHQRRRGRPGRRLRDRQARRLRPRIDGAAQLTMTMIGASLLWVGWFGFNAGSALEANDIAALAFINTLLATAAAVLAWTMGEWMTKGKPSMLGAASGAVAGLVAITPACGFVGPMGALVIGLLAGFVCLWGVNGLKRMLRRGRLARRVRRARRRRHPRRAADRRVRCAAAGRQGIWDYVANKVSARRVFDRRPGLGAGPGVG